MNTKPQTIFSDLIGQIRDMRSKTCIRPFDLTRAKRDAEKLLKTHAPHQGYLCLAELAVFEDAPLQTRLKSVEEYLNKASRLPHDTRNYYITYCNCLVRLGERKSAYSVLDKYVDILEDDIEALRGCFEYTRFTGQISLSEKVINKLNKLGKDMTKEAEEIKRIKTVINESYLKELLVYAGEVLRSYSLINDGLNLDCSYAEDEIFYELTVLADSDEDKVASCDIELSRLKIKFAREKGINLSRFVLGCAVRGID
ncbi:MULTISPECIES: hypothetical protein [unclassified Neisseria]|jgi:hypothetical protein|uniref:hypothetical protein n=1 Tax=unclassified Neisseria TaxID=2623750 RepID=UPI0002D9F94C|nr:MULTISPECIES: hypothetical protein [unclassified Neisseria]OFM01764.1 hypothetical protein HMPREF2726_03515 [Neisseria sp. HMSC074B07]